MRPVGRRKKKLIVAFQFQDANQAAWKCDACRAQGLDVKRRCAWLGPGRVAPPRVVWVGRTVRVTECPKSIISAESIGWIEQYQVGRAFGFPDLQNAPARAVDAFCVLEAERVAEREYANE
jgi:hypothetical protein